MKRALFAVALFSATTVWAAPRDAAQEAAIDQAVSAFDPALVQVVHDANAAMDRGDGALAAAQYGRVHDAAPTVPAITRRLCTAEVRSGKVEEGIRHCTEARGEDPTAENHAALAAALVQRAPLNDETKREALAEASAAVQAAPRAEYAYATLCDVALVLSDVQTLNACATKLKQIAPTTPETHFYGALAALAQRDFDAADDEVEAAEKAGGAPSRLEPLRQRIEAARPRVPLRRRIVTTAFTSLVVSLFVLGVLGLWLNDAAAKSRSRRVRRLYHGLLAFGAFYYYAFAFVVGALFSLVAVLTVYLFVLLASPALPLMIVGGLIGVYLLAGILRASFTRIPPLDEGLRIDLGKEKRLKELLDGVARELKERPIDEVYLRPDASIVFAPRGGVLAHARGRSVRRLYLGAFALEGLSVRSFEARVAGARARYRGPAGITMVARDRLDAMADKMDARGVAQSGNPAWWIVGGYRYLFDKISETAAADQEEFADEQAATLYGAKALRAGVEHLVRREIAVESRAASLFCEAADLGAAPKPRDFDEAWIDYAERAAHIETLDETGLVEAETGDDEDAWSVLGSRERFEKAMNERLRGYVSEELGLTAAPAP